VLLEEHQVAGLDGPTTIRLIPLHVLTENFAERPRLVLRGARDAFLAEQAHGTQQRIGLLLAKDVKDTDILCAERAALTLHRVPDSVTLVAGDERALDPLVGLSDLDGLDSGHACGSWRLLVGFSLRVQTLSIFILDYEHQISIVSRTNKKQGVSLFFIFFSYFQVFRDFEVLIVYLRKNSEVGNPHS